MKGLALVAVALAVALTVPAAADLSGSTVTLYGPLGQLESNTTCMFAFLVTRDWSSTEHVEEVRITFPTGMILHPSTMGYTEVVHGRPSFATFCWGQEATWVEEAPEGGGIHTGELVYLWLDVTVTEGVPPGAVGTIHWRLVGSDGGTNEGYVDDHSPVDTNTWGAIKSMYR
jgi:opacity protein-like surface antigen